ncbi:MAG: serine/threonine protein kinase [Deltaproteobacteria bacterium]|nr:MAG: serine/threonine protein kinase [Deltaproteobacteria bacterium]
MNTPSPKFFCPNCKAAYDVDSNFCGQCGADMHQVSSLLYRRDDGTAASAHRPPRADTQDDAWIGTVVDGRYRVIERIGRGGMGVVYRIVHERMGKVAAMKVLHRELSEERDVVRRFRREAQAVSRLSHPNTVQVFDFGTARGALYLVMEFVKGDDLGVVLKREGPMPFTRAALIMHQICAALAEAHAVQVIHRDLKPENVIVTRTRDGADFIKVLDFGLAKIQEREELAEVTDSGSIVGTPYYMSPEQIRGEDVDARADIYSLGAVLYRMLTGEPPYRAQTPVGVLTQHLTAELVPPSRRAPDRTIPPGVDALVMRALEKDRTRRFQTVEELRAAIDQAYADACGEPPPLLPSGSSWQRTPAGTPAAVAPVDIDFGIDPEQRLNRDDIDQFERRLRRRRIARLVAIPAVVSAAAAMAAYLLWMRPAGPRTVEVEPNNEPDQATPIASGVPVTGYLGKRISRSEPDRDVYALVQRPRPDGSQTLTAHVTGLPNIDIALYLHSADGHFLARADERRVGGDEWLRNYRVTEPVILVVTQAHVTGLPTENVSDTYTLTASLTDATPGTEVEPNDMDSNAVPIAIGATTGYVDRAGDVDAYRFTGPTGRYRVTVSGAGGLPLALRIGADRARTGSAVLELAAGTIVRVEPARPRTAALPSAALDAPYTLELAPAP